MSVIEQKVPEGFKKTEVGIIPDKWEIHLLNDISVISRLAGAEYTSMWKENPAGEIIALRGFNIGKNRIINRELTRIDNSLSLKLKRSRLTKGDVIYPCVGSIGNAAVIYENDKYHIQQNIARITPKLEKLYSEYLCHFLMSELAFKEVERFTATTSQPSVLVSSLRQYRVPMPENLQEQTAIANALSDVDALLTELEKLIAKKQAIKTATMQQLLTGKTRLPQFATYTEGEKQGQPKGTKPSELGEIPENWDVSKLGDLGKFKNGINKDADSFGHGSPFVNLMDVFGKPKISGIEDFGLINSTALEKKEYSISKGDVLFIRSSVKPSGVGLTSVALANIDNTVYSGFLIRFRSNKKLDDNFKIHCFYDESFRKRIIAASTVSANTNINQDALKEIQIAYPIDIDEQTAITTVLSDMDNEIQNLEQRLAKTRQIKQGMMQELLTGRTRLPF